ncbi:Sugar kinase of the NBD/HSP70 family, may contain an N-terminal HTH domain [Actinopolymorpha cephalotaxi]|nr:ROK family transcriptional regulator [Actinopolymorpha cephalotaxi]SFH71565.1 Sugar kinase of the NBD/HSP70 family, may contain an N-terminal HTH domain [Actinopolymorpha cephalotaxi]
MPPTSAEFTRSVILDYIRASGSISRVELARMSGLTQAAISTIVRRIIADGLVVESGYSESTGGKRRTLLELNASARFAVGVSLEYRRLTFVVTDLSGHLVGRLSTDGPRETSPRQVMENIAERIEPLLAYLQVDPELVVGIGIAIPGPLDSSLGIVQGRLPTSAWTGLRLKDMLEAVAGRPVVVDNDASCAALGEYWTNRHAAYEKTVTATVYMAGGIGCGILTEGRIFHGVSSNAGEIGHIILDVNGPPCPCGSRGCVGLYASPDAVVTKAGRDPDLVKHLGLTLEADEVQGDFRRLVRAAARGHGSSHQLIANAASYLGAAVTTLANILDLDEVYLSGPGFSDAGALYARVIQDTLDRGAFMRSIHPVQVKMSHIGPEAAALGAAALVLQRHLTPHSVRESARRRPAPASS